MAFPNPAATWSSKERADDQSTCPDSWEDSASLQDVQPKPWPGSRTWEPALRGQALPLHGPLFLSWGGTFCCVWGHGPPWTPRRTSWGCHFLPTPIAAQEPCSFGDADVWNCCVAPLGPHSPGFRERPGLCGVAQWDWLLRSPHSTGLMHSKAENTKAWLKFLFYLSFL